MKKSKNSVKIKDIIEPYYPSFNISESDIIHINKIVDNMEIIGLTFLCPLKVKPYPDRESLLNNCVLCKLLFPKIDKILSCPCDFYTNKDVIKIVKDFSKKFYNKLSEINYKYLEVETSDIKVLCNEFTAFRITHQDEIVDEYLHCFLKYYLNTVKFISDDEPKICDSLLKGKILFFVRGRNKDRDNRIIFIDKKFKDRIIKSIELLNEDISEYKMYRVRKSDK